VSESWPGAIYRNMTDCAANGRGNALDPVAELPGRRYNSGVLYERERGAEGTGSPKNDLMDGWRVRIVCVGMDSRPILRRQFAVLA
jgi:hypothetical protein